MITFTGYNNSSNPRIADKNLNVISHLEGISCTLKNDCSVQQPVIILRDTHNVHHNLNYFYIQEFDRYYYITDITLIRDDLYQVSGKTDVLTTAFKRVDGDGNSRLGKCQGIVYRSQSDQCYNLYLDDGYFKVQNRPKIQTKPFSNSFNTHSFVMMVAGG